MGGMDGSPIDMLYVTHPVLYAVCFVYLIVCLTVCLIVCLFVYVCVFVVCSLHEQSTSWKLGGRKLKSLPLYDPKKFTYTKKVAPRNPVLVMLESATAADDASTGSGDTFSTSHVSADVSSIDSITHPHVDYSTKLLKSSKLAIISAKQSTRGGNSFAKELCAVDDGEDDALAMGSSSSVVGAENSVDTVIGPTGLIVAKTKVYTMTNRAPMSGPLGVSKSRIKSLLARRSKSYTTTITTTSISSRIVYLLID